VRAGDGVLARTGGNETVFQFDYALAERIPVSLEAFRNRFVAEEAEADDTDALEADASDEDDGFLPPSDDSP
jgi:hypothetical protein